MGREPRQGLTPGYSSTRSGPCFDHRDWPTSGLLLVASVAGRRLVVWSCWGKPEERRRGRRAQRAEGAAASAVGSVCGAATSVFIDEEIGDGNRLGAVGARAAGSDPTAEGVAVRAVLLAEEARLAGRALVDGGRPWRPVGDGDDRRARLTSAPGGLAAGVRAEASPPDRRERSRAAGARYRYAIVT